MRVDPALRQRAEQARAWMMDAAFPLWAEQGCHDGVGFCEALDLQGRPIMAATSRVRVQARQTYSFALAFALGWQSDRATDLVSYGLDTLTIHCQRSDGLFGTLLDHCGGLKDDSPLLYDTAFALLAFAEVLRAGFNEAAPILEATDAAIEAQLRRPPPGEGYGETLPHPADRNQNPHMHLYEASLAMAEVARDSGMARAQDLEALMERRFLSLGDGGLRERFTGDWGPHPDDHFEAGHQYEWVWLLHKRSRLNAQPVSSAAKGLYQKAMALTEPRGALFLEHTLEGTIRAPYQRCWGLTEALKAHLAQLETGNETTLERAIMVFDRLWDLHISPAVEGGWIDRYDQDNEPLSKDIPASTGYHIFLALRELIRVADLS